MKSLLCKKEKKKVEFVEIFTKQVAVFRRHMFRITEQYRQIKMLKETMPDNHAIVHMDFAENYVCQGVEAPQGAGYYDATYVSLHPAVIYYKDERGLQKVSEVFVSDSLTHSAISVNTIMKQVVEHVKGVCPNITCIHYLTDSPSSQYRNQKIAYMVSHHTSLFGVQAAWIYFEAGHGKGACDGVGGTSKRMADDAVKHQKCIIQNALDYYTWAKSSATSIQYFFYTSEDVLQSQKDIDEMNTTPIIGIMKIHSMVCPQPGLLYVRETSCYGRCCFVDGVFNPTCEGWILHEVPMKQHEDEEHDEDDNEKDDEDDDEMETSDDESDDDVAAIPSPYAPHDYVAAVYQRNWYIGKVIKVEGSRCFIRFMAHTRYQRRFIWPTQVDEMWVDQSEIICKIDRPTKVGSGSKSYTLRKASHSEIISLWEDFLKA